MPPPHRRQGPPQALSQQTPSTQNPLAQSSPSPHFNPLATRQPPRPSQARSPLQPPPGRCVDRPGRQRFAAPGRGRAALARAAALACRPARAAAAGAVPARPPVPPAPAPAGPPPRRRLRLAPPTQPPLPQAQHLQIHRATVRPAPPPPCPAGAAPPPAAAPPGAAAGPRTAVGPSRRRADPQLVRDGRARPQRQLQQQAGGLAGIPTATAAASKTGQPGQVDGPRRVIGEWSRCYRATAPPTAGRDRRTPPPRRPPPKPQSHRSAGHSQRAAGGGRHRGRRPQLQGSSPGEGWCRRSRAARGNGGNSASTGVTARVVSGAAASSARALAGRWCRGRGVWLQLGVDVGQRPGHRGGVGGVGRLRQEAAVLLAGQLQPTQPHLAVGDVDQEARPVRQAIATLVGTRPPPGSGPPETAARRP